MTEEQRLRAEANVRRFSLLAFSLLAGARLSLLFFLSFLPGGPPLLGSWGRLKELARDVLQADFDVIVGEVAPVALESTHAWHGQMKKIIEGYLLSQAIAALGRPLLPTELIEIQPTIDRQLKFLSDFLLDLIQREITVEYVTSRARLYSGAGRALWYRVAEARDGEGWVVDYHAVDDKGTCFPCHAAEAEGPYLMGEGPMPGDVCLGRGRCRCQRIPRFDRQAWEILKNTVQEAA